MMERVNYFKYPNRSWLDKSQRSLLSPFLASLPSVRKFSKALDYRILRKKALFSDRLSLHLLSIFPQFLSLSLSLIPFSVPLPNSFFVSLPDFFVSLSLSPHFFYLSLTHSFCFSPTFTSFLCVDGVSYSQFRPHTTYNPSTQYNPTTIYMTLTPFSWSRTACNITWLHNSSKGSFLRNYYCTTSVPRHFFACHFLSFTGRPL